MQLGECDRCQTPFTRDDVAAYGILKARTAARGGPRVRYRCPKCSNEIELVPHGRHRYTRPGEPSHATTFDDEQNPNVSIPWQDHAKHRSVSRDESESKHGPASERNAPHRSNAASDVDQVHIDPQPGLMTRESALDLMGLTSNSTADEIDEAFRRHAQASHPDKVAHLDPAIQAFASKRFLKLREAYDLILRTAPPSE